MVSSSERTSARGSHRSFLFLEQTVCFLPSSLIALGWSDNPHCVPQPPRSRSWSLCGNLPSFSPPTPSSALQTPLPLLPFSPPPSPSSLPVIVPAEVGRGQLFRALRGKWQSHNQCCWLCWCRGVKVCQC